MPTFMECGTPSALRLHGLATVPCNYSHEAALEASGHFCPDVLHSKEVGIGMLLVRAHVVLFTLIRIIGTNEGVNINSFGHIFSSSLADHSTYGYMVLM